MRMLLLAAALAPLAAPAGGAETRPWAWPSGVRHAIPDRERLEVLFRSRKALPHIFMPQGGTRDALLRSLEGALARAPGPRERARLLEDLAHVQAMEPSSLEEAARSLARARAEVSTLDPALAQDLLAKEGIVELKLGETRNCALNHNADSCVFPLSEKARHADKAGSRAAAALFLEYLKRDPDDHQVRWLLNLAHMTLGTHPDGVPAAFRVRAPADDRSFPRFRNRAGAAGLMQLRAAGGAAIGDFNGDDCPDLVLTSPLHGVSYFESDCKGGFVDKTAGSGLDAQPRGVFNLLQADYDNDGRTDLYLLRGAWSTEAASGVRNTLLRNVGGRFLDVTDETGLGKSPNSNLAAVWLDMDGDGWLDLFVCSEKRAPDLFRNERGRFVQAIEASGIVNNAVCKGAAAADVDGDGRMDLFISNFGARNALWINKGGGRFERSPQPELEEHPLYSFTSFFFDYDNDGRPDLFVAAFDPRTERYFAREQGVRVEADTLRVFRNRGKGRFEDVTARLGLDTPVPVMGANFGDLDNDGYPDLFLGTGSLAFGDLVPNKVYRNAGGRSFVDVTTAGGFGNLQKGHAVSFGDVDNDGDQDLLVSMGGGFDSDLFFPDLLENPGFPSHWLTLRLVGVRSNRSGLGSTVSAEIVEDGRTRVVRATAGGTGSFGANSLLAHVGLGRAARIKTLRVRWQGSGLVQSFSDVAADRLLTLREGGALEESRAPRYALGAGSDAAPPHHHAP